ncbi:SH3 domain-containing protein [Bacillus sp. FJAT-52991]|uniref:SH3 domain-containing protein n=1 Tax=Bacillus kandeliae TaxID=3129297 RepID=A0ABZ2N689_9BACI
MFNRMKYILVFLLSFSLLFPSLQAEASAVNQHFTVTAKTLNVREKPSPRAKIVGSLKKGTVVYVYNKEPGGWSKIKYNGKAGYVASSYLKAESNTKISRSEAKKILIKTKKIDTKIAGVRSDPEMDQVVNGVTYYFFDVYALTEGFAASSYFVSSKDGRVLTWSQLEKIGS